MEIFINYNSNSLSNYYERFYFKFECCKTFDEFVTVNKSYIQNRVNHGTLHDFMRLISIDFDRKELEKEYDTAFCVLQMCEKWEDIKRNQNVFSKVKFSVVIDGLTNLEERKLHNVVLDIDDPLLDLIFPPNSFSDRTTVLKVLDYKEQITSTFEIPVIERKLQNNVGKYFKIDDADFFAVPISDENLKTVENYYKKRQL